MTRDLPKRLYLHGRSYRLALPDGRKVNLGRDVNTALIRYHVLMNPASPMVDEPMVAESIWRRHAKGAKQRKLEFTITVDDVRAALATQDFRCAMTLLPFRADKPDGLRIRPWAPSLDRIDSRHGYVPGNVRVVCAFVNVAMNGFGEQFFSLVLEPLVEATIAARGNALYSQKPVLFPNYQPMGTDTHAESTA